MSTRARRIKSRPSIAEQRKKLGRPTKLNDRVRLQCVKLLRTGAPRTVAARAAGISKDSFNEYKLQGEHDTLALTDEQFETLTTAAIAEVAGEQRFMNMIVSPDITPFAKFSAAVEAAEAYFLEFGFSALSSAGAKGDSRALFGMLARLLGREYQDPTNIVRHAGADGETLDTSPKFIIGRMILPDNNRPVAPPTKRKK